jgi:bacterioferritin
MYKKKLLELLNKALADEWLSYYKYWIGAKVIVGKMKEQVATELEEMATAELKHAGMLVDKIIKLAGTPILKPKDWCKTANCSYDVPKAFSIKTVLFQNIKSEQCTIDAYKKLVNITKRKKPTISELLKSILEEEIEHKDDLINMVEHMEITKS